MSHPLSDRLRRVARRARRLTLWHAASWFLAATVTTLLLVGLADYLIRSDETALRFVATGCVLAAMGWAFWRFLRPAAKRQLSDLQIADRIEKRFPEFEGQVTSTVAFLTQGADDALAGSYEMRRAVVSQTVADLEGVNLGDCLDASAARKALAAAAMVVAAGIAICAAWPTTAAHATTRLLLPWDDHPWPRRNALAFIDPPQRLAKGADLEVEIVDHNGNLPEDIALEVWGEGDARRQVREAVFVGGKMLARVNNVSRGFRYRAVGGDDQTPWRRLEVVQPPSVADYTARVTPPQYSGWPSEEFDGDIRGLVGSRIMVEGAADQPLANAVLKFLPTGQDDEDAALEIPLTVRGDKFRSADAWTIKGSGAYWIELVDQREVANSKPTKWGLESVPDNPPTVAVDGASLPRYATSTAIVPLIADARDDIAVKRVELSFRRAGDDDAPPEVIPIWEGPDEPPQRTSSQSLEDRREVEFQWRLEAAPGLQPGDVLEYELAAIDYAGGRGAATSQRLTIVPRSELEDRLGRSQAYILERIREALAAQRESRKQIQALEIQWEQTKAFSKADGDQLQSAELNQRQVTRLLAGPQDGVVVLINNLIKDIANNRLNNPELERRLAELSRGVTGVVKRLPDIQRPLLSSLKDVRPALLNAEADQPVTVAASTADQIRTAGGVQDEVIAQLERLLGDLSQWENYRRFAREVGRIQREQADVERQTDQLRLKTLTQDLQSLSPEQRAKLLRLAQQQLGLAQRLDKLQSRMGEASRQLAEQDPLTAETLADGAAAAQRMAISGQMRESARRLGANQVGQAKQRQEEVNDALSELLNILGNRREDELDRKLRKLDELADALAGLEQREQATADQLSEAAQAPDNEETKRQLERLAKQQESLSQEAADAARRLERLEAQQPSSSLGEASESMSNSAQSAQQGGSQSGARKAEQQAKSALEKLQQARRELEEQIRQTQQDLFYERLARLEERIRGLALRQQSVLETTSQLKQSADAGELPRAQQATLSRLAEHQGDLGGETSNVADKVAEAKVFSLALEAAAREMARAARYLEDSQLAEAESSGTVALKRLQQVIDALQPEPPSSENSQNQQPQQGQPNQPPPPADSINQLAQLKLVKSLQVEIQRRTAELEKLSVSRPLSPEQLAEYEDLAQEQGRLADIIEDLIQSAEEAARQAEPEEIPAEGDLENDLLRDLEKQLESPDDAKLDADLLKDLENSNP